MRREILTLILGLVMIFSGAYFLIVCVTAPEFQINGEFASALVLILAGISIVVYLRKDLKHGIIASLMALGISMILQHIHLLFDPVESLELLISDAYLIISTVLIYYAISLIFHTSAGSTKALVCLGLLAVTEFLPTIYRLYMGDGLLELISKNRDSLIHGILHITILIILSRKEMLLEGATKRLERNSRYLYDEMCTPPDSYIDVRDVNTLIAEPNTGWTEVDDDSPILLEKRVMLHGSDMEILLQRKADDRRVHISVCPKDRGSYSIPLTFPIESMVMDSNDPYSAEKIRIYGTDGIFMDILIRDYDKERKTYIETIRYRHWKHRMDRP